MLVVRLRAGTVRITLPKSVVDACLILDVLWVEFLVITSLWESKTNENLILVILEQKEDTKRS